jgi:hypothetical protein
LDLKRVLKRGALVAAANWQTVAIQFVAETTFQLLLAVPIVGAAVLVAALLGADLAELLQGSLRDIFTSIASALLSEPVALGAFIAAFLLVLLGGSVLMFVVKGGTVDVIRAANADAGPIEREPLTIDTLRSAARFTKERFRAGCARLYRRYVTLGVALMIIYALSGGGYIAVVVYGYRVAAGRVLVLFWTFTAAMALPVLVAWITLVNLLYLLLQIAIAIEDVGLLEGAGAVIRFVHGTFRELAGVFFVVLVLVFIATLASALAWSGVGLIAFVPLVGLAVFPLQVAAFLVRGLVFEYLGLTALSAYITLYAEHAAGSLEAPDGSATPTAEPAASAQA